jgi:hypothetical protein
MEAIREREREREREWTLSGLSISQLCNLSSKIILSKLWGKFWTNSSRNYTIIENEEWQELARTVWNVGNK